MQHDAVVRPLQLRQQRFEPLAGRGLARLVGPLPARQQGASPLGRNWIADRGSISARSSSHTPFWLATPAKACSCGSRRSKSTSSVLYPLWARLLARPNAANAFPSSPSGLVTATVVAPRASHVCDDVGPELVDAPRSPRRACTGRGPSPRRAGTGITPTTGTGVAPFTSASELTRRVIVSKATTPSAISAKPEQAREDGPDDLLLRVLLRRVRRRLNDLHARRRVEFHLREVVLLDEPAVDAVGGVQVAGSRVVDVLLPIGPPGRVRGSGRSSSCFSAFASSALAVSNCSCWRLERCRSAFPSRAAILLASPTRRARSKVSAFSLRTCVELRLVRVRTPS